MLVFRGALAVLMVVVGAFIVTQMLHYPVAQSFTGIVLGGAMILLGLLRFRQVREAMRQR
jgi:xanthine/uracil/vitamin C permease (AzgA family)